MAKKKAKSKNWIAGAIKKPGSFTAAAKKAGKTTAAYAAEKASAPGVLGKRARLAQTLAKLSKKRKRKGG
jgi:hypothetical protein